MIKLFRNLKSWAGLRRINQELLIENSELQGEIEEMKKRLRRAGMMPYEYFENRNVHIVTAEGIPYGNFAMMDNGCTDEDIEKAKEKVAVILAKGIIDSGLCQFIVRNNSDHLSISTVGIKLFVVPWEQMTRKIVLFPAIEEETDGKHQDEDNIRSKAGSGYTCVFTGEIETGKEEDPGEPETD